MQSGREGPTNDPLIEEAQPPEALQSFYRGHSHNLSTESLDSEALLDHRDQPTLRPRRDSRVTPQFATPYRNSLFPKLENGARRRHRSQQGNPSHVESDNEDATDRTPLIPGAAQHKSPEQSGYGLFRLKSNTSTLSAASKRAQRKRQAGTPSHSFPKFDLGYDINNPPSRPASPAPGAQPDVMVDDMNFLARSPDIRRDIARPNSDVLIDIDGDEGRPNSAPPSPRLRPGGLQRHRSLTAEADVCFPGEEASEVGEYFDRVPSQGQSVNGHRRRRREREWPTLWALDDWSREEKEARAAGERRAKKDQ